MTLADLKPAKRIVDPDAYTAFHALGLRCLVCGKPNPNAAHILDRGRSGDDCLDNFMPLCGSGSGGCHGAEHGNAYFSDVLEKRITPAQVRGYIGKWLKAPEQRAKRAYLVQKLGRGPAESYVRRNFGVRS